MRPLPELLAKVDEQKVRARERQAQEVNVQDLVPQQGDLFLPAKWGNQQRAVPNVVARSALVAVLEKGAERTQLDREPIASLEGTTIEYTGKQWTADEMDVLMQLIHTGRQFPLETPFSVTGHQLLKALGWGRNDESYTRVRNAINILIDATLRIRCERPVVPHTKPLTFIGGFLKDVVIVGDEANGGSRWQMAIDRRVIPLFNENLYTIFEWQRRVSLKSPMAKWLHLYYETHENPHPLSTPRLHKLMGSRNENMPSFRQTLKKAHQTLEEKGLIRKAHYDPASDTHRIEHLPKRAGLGATPLVGIPGAAA